MSSISRSDFKYNFLKDIIVRIDFQGVFESELEKLVPLIKPELKEEKFSRYERKKNNQIEVNVANMDLQSQALGKIQSQDIHSFINEDKGYVLDISSDCICLSISSTSYSPFEDYSRIVLKVVNVYRENIDFFTITRIGIRKINICMLEDIKRIKEFFSSDYFGYFTAISGVNTFLSERKDAFSIADYKANLFCNVEKGISNDKTLYKVSLDIDMYVDDSTIIGKTGISVDKLNEMNNLIFDIYIKSLTEGFKNALLGNDYLAFEGLIGVEKNE